MRTRKILTVVLVTCSSCFLPACDFLEECGQCEMVTVHPDGSETRTAPIPLCGDDLRDKQNFIPETVDGNTIYWECY